MTKDTICLILGGGAGSRLYPLTEKRSKPAVPIGGKYRLIDIPISNCINSGISRMFVVTQYNSASLNAHIKNAYNFDSFTRGFVDILAAEQTPGSEAWFEGTADAIRKSQKHYERHKFDYVLILSGDQLYQMDFNKMIAEHEKQKADLTIACLPVNAKDATGFGIMKVGDTGAIDTFIEKPTSSVLGAWKSNVSPEDKREGKEYMASMGIYIFSRQALSDLFAENPEAMDFGKDIIPTAILGGRKVAAYQYNGYWTDIGTISSFFEANLEFTGHIPSFNLFDEDKPIYTRARMLPPAKFYGGTQIHRSIVAEGSVIQARLIDSALIGIRSRVMANSVLKNCIMMGADQFQSLIEIENLKADEVAVGVGENCHIENAILDKDCCIGNNVTIKGGKHMPNLDAEGYCVRDGIVVVRKGGTIHDNTRIV